jgi:hypothetical protein
MRGAQTLRWQPRGSTELQGTVDIPRLKAGGFQLLHRLEQQARFAVHRPGNPVASPRSHGVPRRDVDGRVHVSVTSETAGSAPEHGLALTRRDGLGQLLACDAMLMGRHTYDFLASAHPSRTDPWGARVNPLQKYVFSSTLEVALWDNSTIVRSDVVC